MQKTTEAVGTTYYQINRVYLGPDVPLTVAPVADGELVVNLGLVAAHLSTRQARELVRALGDALVMHDVRYRTGDVIA